MIPDSAVVLALLLLALVLVALARAVVLSKVPLRVDHALKLASTTYGVPYQEMVAVSRCETGGDWNPRSYNASSGASGLFQFLHGTWLRTPYGRFDVFDPYANSLAAAWLVRKDGGWSEWSCGWAAHR